MVNHVLLHVVLWLKTLSLSLSIAIDLRSISFLHVKGASNSVAHALDLQESGLKRFHMILSL